jgi:enoyl-[acyl-carrier-protein] reductase (NADH)
MSQIVTRLGRMVLVVHGVAFNICGYVFSSMEGYSVIHMIEGYSMIHMVRRMVSVAHDVAFSICEDGYSSVIHMIESYSMIHMVRRMVLMLTSHSV